MFREFKSFLLKQNAIALAIGVIIGAAIGKVVSSIAENVINPVIGLLLPGGGWRQAAWVLKSHLDPKTGQNVVDAAIGYGPLRGSARGLGRVIELRRVRDHQGDVAETGSGALDGDAGFDSSSCWDRWRIRGRRRWACDAVHTAGHVRRLGSRRLGRACLRRVPADHRGAAFAAWDRADRAVGRATGAQGVDGVGGTGDDHRRSNRLPRSRRL